MSWDRKFSAPIPVPKGPPLVRLRDAGTYITRLPKEQHDAMPWQTAMDCLLLVADQGGPIDFADIAMRQALHPKREPVYHSASKDPKWRNNYKLVRDR